MIEPEVFFPPNYETIEITKNVANRYHELLLVCLM